ncbi:MAG: glycine oxidase ThiO [Proteobacteria bacterium]|nr:glycine oxidase ThiO [Pseudomonadota bacterium]
MSDKSTGSIRPSIAVIGSGICGLGIGWRLAAAGCRVDIFERGEAGREASWAAAGMLAAHVETEPGEEMLLALNLESQAAWPAFAAELAAVSGVDVGYRDEGTLVVAAHRDDVAELRNTYEFQRGLGLEIDWLTGGQARRMEPHLAPGVSGAVFSRKDHQVDNRQLVTALRAAFLAAGGTLHEHTAVDAVDVSGNRARGVVVGGRRHEADVVLLAAGAWSYDIDGLPPLGRPPVRPLKGQVISLRMDPRAPVIDHVLWGPGIYIVPRRDGTLILGATVEDKGFDRDLTAGGIFRLLEAAWEILPQIEELPVKEMWVGFRPTSRDDAPILGPTPVDGLVVATGHHRNGVLLAPVTIDAVSRFVLDGVIRPAIQPFGIDRFHLSDIRQVAKGQA